MTRFFGLPFLPADEIENSFVEDVMADAPNDEKCGKFADYILENYILDTAAFSPLMWASVPEENAPKTNNGLDSFHAHFNSQFYAGHSLMF